VPTYLLELRFPDGHRESDTAELSQEPVGGEHVEARGIRWQILGVRRHGELGLAVYVCEQHPVEET